KIIEIKKETAIFDIPIFLGIMPVTTSRNAEFLHNEVPGIKLTDEVRERMRKVAGDKAQSTAESIAISKDLIDTALEHFNGIYLITPFMRYDITIELVEYIREKTKVLEKV